jgi:hypothetical protein
MASQTIVEGASRRRPWHMWVVTFYLFVSGLWTSTGLVSGFVFNGVPLMPNLGIALSGLLMIAACFAGAYTLYRGSRLALLCIVLIPVVQWMGFALLFPGRVGISHFSINLDYFRQLPPLLLANLAFDGLIVLYALFLLKTRRLS